MCLSIVAQAMDWVRTAEFPESVQAATRSWIGRCEIGSQEERRRVTLVKQALGEGLFSVFSDPWASPEKNDFTKCALARCPLTHLLRD